VIPDVQLVFVTARLARRHPSGAGLPHEEYDVGIVSIRPEDRPLLLRPRGGGDKKPCAKTCRTREQ